MVERRRQRILSALVVVAGIAVLSGAILAGPKVKEFHSGIATEVARDQALTIRLKGKVKPKHLTPDFIRITDGTGASPRGEFIQGTPLLDPDTGTIVVIDPDQIGPRLLAKIEKKGAVKLVPLPVRYDLGAVSDLIGNRAVLIDRSAKKTITFLPEVPTRLDLSDAGFAPGTTYTLEVGKPGKKKNFTTTFTTSSLFGGEPQGPLQVVNTRPWDGEDVSEPDPRIFIRFSTPLDPRTVNEEGFRVEIASISGRPRLPVSTLLRQARLGLVEVVLTPLLPYPADASVEVTVTGDVLDLSGAPLDGGPHTFSFAVDGVAYPDPLDESFESNLMEDAAATTASWNGTEPGALVAAPAGDSVGTSLWYDTEVLTPDYGATEIDQDAGGGSIAIFVQGAGEDISRPGSQPVDPEDDPLRLFTTDWEPIAELDRLDNFEYLRFRVEFTAGAPLPVVRGIRITVGFTAY